MSDQTPVVAPPPNPPTDDAMGTIDEEGEYTPRQVVADDLGGMSLEDAIAGTIVEFDDGDIVKGTVVKVDKDEVLLDIGFKSEGVIPARTGTQRASPSTGRPPRTSRRKTSLMSTATTSAPLWPNAAVCRPGPHPTSSSFMPGANPSASHKNDTSSAVPRVNEYRRYATPACAASGSNHRPLGGCMLTPWRRPRCYPTKG